jgi:hypothetical protein
MVSISRRYSEEKPAMAAKRRKKQTSAVLIIIVAVLVVVIPAALAGIVLLVLYLGGDGGTPSPGKEKVGPGATDWLPDPELAKNLQEQETVLKRSGFRFRLPRNWAQTPAAPAAPGFEDYFFVGQDVTHKDGSHPDLFIREYTIGDGEWPTVSQDLRYLLKKAFEFLDRKYNLPHQQGAAELGRINGVDFIKAPADVQAVGRHDFVMVYFCVSRPHQLLIRARAFDPDHERTLRLIESSIRTLKR